MDRERYQCCFCGKEITPAPPDVAGLLLVTSIDADEESQRTQQFYCHAQCFRDRLHSSVPAYVLSEADD